MPPLNGKVAKSKGRDGRQSRSRNTTPISSISASSTAPLATHTAYLETPLSSLMIPANLSYDSILDRLGGNGNIPDAKTLETIYEEVGMLKTLAQERAKACNNAFRLIAERRKEILEEERIREQAAREAEERESLKRTAEDEENSPARKGAKLKKRKERATSKDRPLAVGAHGLARQDGGEGPVTGSPSSTVPSKRKLDTISGSSSPLSPPSRIQSPDAKMTKEPIKVPKSPSSESSSSAEARQPAPAPSVPKYETFGPDPLRFPDPTVYEIREIVEGMSEEEKKEIFGVTVYPQDDLSHLIAGTPPDKDFSNTKPTNQVNPNTFAAYIEPYLRPLNEEDMNFLRDRGDRVTPFLMPRRGPRHYTEVWAEEDGSVSSDHHRGGQEGLPPNQPRGNLEQMSDDVAETDQVSNGPLLNRLLALMIPENRPPPAEDTTKPNGLFTNGTNVEMNDVLMNGLDAPLDPLEIPLTNGTTTTITNINGNPESPEKALPPATAIPEFSLPFRNPTNSSTQAPQPLTPKLDHAQIDERIKVELRHLGFLPPDADPDYDAHEDDEVAERLRLLQRELKEVSILNGARKAKLAAIAQERLAYQEYATILEDLDGQVQQAYQKRTRNIKHKKQVKRPGGAGGGSHFVNSADGGTAAGSAANVGSGVASTAGGADVKHNTAAAAAAASAASLGISRPALGDNVKALVERRRRWQHQIGPVFANTDVNKVRTEGEDVFDEASMKGLMERERERWDEEVGE